MKQLSDLRLLATYRMYSFVLVGLCVTSMVVHKGSDVLFINGAHNPWLDEFFKNITSLGEGMIFVPIFIATLFIRFQYSVACALTLVSHALASMLFKQVIFADMPRPKSVLSADLLHFIPGVEVHGTHSFPSGHTMTVFGAAMFMALLSRNTVIGAMTLFFALLVGCSRIYLLQHFLMDVTAGALIGAFTTYVVWWLLDASAKPEWMYRRIRMAKGSRRSTVHSAR